MTTAPRLPPTAIQLFAIAVASCGPAAPQEVLTVDEVVPRIDALNGRTVSVAGYLPHCGGYTCILYRTREEAEEVDRGIAALRAGEPLNIPDFPALSIGIGPNWDFDAKAGPFEARYVVITGTITNECRFQGKPACMDRGPDLKPTSIRAGTPPGHQPGR
jgi:hypothetical protein